MSIELFEYVSMYNALIVSQVLSISLGLALLTLTNLRWQSQSNNHNKQIWVLSVALIPNLLNLLIIGMSACICCKTVPFTSQGNGCDSNFSCVQSSAGLVSCLESCKMESCQ